jgi:hypothetical protein
MKTLKNIAVRNNCPWNFWFSFWIIPYFTPSFWDKVLLYSSGWPQIYDPTVSVSWVLGLQACSTMPSYFAIFNYC